MALAVLALSWLPAKADTVSPPPGTCRSLVGSGAGTAKTASWACEYLVVATALDGDYFANDTPLTTANLAFNGATTGAGGMDTGATPTSGTLYVYAIYNPTTLAWSTLGTTTSAGASIYAGTHLPSGYTASGLIWSGVTDSTGKVQKFAQQDRHISILRKTVLDILSSVPTTYTALSVNSCVPANAKTVDGMIGGQDPSSDMVACMASDSSGTFETACLVKIITGGPTGPYFGFYGTVPFSHFPLITAQTVYYKSLGSGNPVKIDLNGYTF